MRIFIECVCVFLNVAPIGCLTLEVLPRIELPELPVLLADETEDTPKGKSKRKLMYKELLCFVQLWRVIISY
jgi:hypothetical protein